MKTLKSIFLISISLLLIAPINGWNNHAGLTYIILKDYWKTNSPTKVKAESLSSFIAKEKDKLPIVLSEIDTFIETKLPHFQKPKAELIFDPTSIDKKNAELTFYRALRVNPNHKAFLYTQAVQTIAKKPSPILDSITTLNEKGKLPLESFLPLTEGSSVSPLEILVTAVDEPDYDLDLYLFEDNNSEVGKIYGFGEQSFGNPAYEYSSQAPFHMGFYHESGIVFTLAGFLKRTYPEFRYYQFTKLSEFAFKTGHPYWGYRFAGWALHYLQDLTQPYHSSVLPRIGVGKLLRVEILAKIGFSKSKEEMVDYVTARHTMIEEYQYYLIKDLIKSNAKDHLVFKALQTSSLPTETIKMDYDSIRSLVTKQAFDTAIEADMELEHLGIPKYEKLYEPDHPIHHTLAKLLTKTSIFTRAYLDGLNTR
ncbi:MAG: hypothetical protein SH817_05310 [Leptospira sp.]|nr:hypothetical protein [Leptospira sp.]